MNFLEKLDYLMDKFDLNKRALSQKSGIPYTTIDAWYKKGYEGLKIPTLRKLAEYFNTTLDYWVIDEITDPNYGKSSGFKIEYEEMEHMKKYRSLTDTGRDHVNTVLDWEVEYAQQTTSQPVRLIRYYQQLVSAGSGEVVFDDVPDDVIAIPDTHSNRLVTYAIRVKGSSMEPQYSDGDILLVEQTTRIDTGEIGVFVMDGESYVKKLGETELISLNKDYTDIPLTDSTQCMGRVVSKL